MKGIEAASTRLDAASAACTLPYSVLESGRQRRGGFLRAFGLVTLTPARPGPAFRL
ncbi:MAG: hypothetical protein ACRYHQ_06655 [Janthinobacterium lividum]